MAQLDPYLSVEEFRARINFSDDEDGLSDAILSVLLSASRIIDNFCGKDPGGFNQSDPQARFFTPSPYTDSFIDPGLFRLTTAVWVESLDVDEVVSISEIAVDDGDRGYETIVNPLDYDLRPYNNDVKGLPFTQISQTNTFKLFLPAWQKGVRVTGVWGWPAVPEPVKQATHLIANRNKSLWNAPFGSTGSSSGDMGGLNMTTAISPIIAEMLQPYRALTL